MQVNSHFALGMIVGLISYHFFKFPLMITLIIIGAAAIQDLDFLFSKYAKNNNHRYFFTHSIWPTVIVVSIGLILGEAWIIITGISIFTHIFVDMMDWGLNLFYNGKIIGLGLLNPELKGKTIDYEAEGIYYKQFYFTKKYFSSKLFVSMDLAFLITCIVLIIVTQFPWPFLMIAYVITWAYHLNRYFQQKKENERYKNEGIEDNKNYL